MRYGLVTLLFVTSCGPSMPTPTTPKIKLNPGWGTLPASPQIKETPLFVQSNGVHVLEGSSEFIASMNGQFGLVLSDQRNDIARITELYAQEVEDFPGTLVLFTQFQDSASFSSAYFLPIYNPTSGTGMPAYDRRATFGTRQIEGFVNVQTLQSHGSNLLDVLTHEITHRHAAYLKALVSSSTTPLSLLGREAAHWHAAFNSQGSLLEGYHWRESGPGRFVSIDKQSALAPIDLYALGLIAPEELSNLFFIQNATVESGAALPASADLPLGTVVRGERIDISGSDIVAALGPRVPQQTMDVRFLYLTQPGAVLTSSTVQNEIRAIEQVRLQLEGHWLEQTSGVGQLRTTQPKPGQADAETTRDLGQKVEIEASNCQCDIRATLVGHSSYFNGLSFILLLFFFRLCAVKRRKGHSS